MATNVKELQEKFEAFLDDPKLPHEEQADVLRYL